MRIVMDTGDLHNLASVAGGCAHTVGVINGDVRRALHAVSLNTRDDAGLRRHRPHDVANDIERGLRTLEQDYEARARRYEQRARQIENAESIRWRPLLIPILVGPPGSQWRIAQLANLPDPGSVLRPLLSIRPPALPGPRPHEPIAAPRSPSLIEQGVGLISRGIDAIRRGFQDVTSKIVDTVAGAWQRIWNRTSQILRSVVHGLRNIVVFGATIAVDGYRTITTTVGRWVTGAAHAAWSFLGKTWDLIDRVGDFVFTVLDIRAIVKFALSFDGLINFYLKMTSVVKLAPRYLGRFWWVGTVVGGIDAIAQFVQHGVGDARFWRSLVETVGGLGAMVAAAAVGAPAAFGAIAFGLGMWIGTQLSNVLVMPFINRYYDNIAAEHAARVDREIGASRGERPATEQSEVPAAIITPSRSAAAVRGLYEAWATGRFAVGGESHYQCTAWANYRWNELGWKGEIPGHGGAMAKNTRGPVSATPTLHALGSYGVGVDTDPGHVVVVEEISADGSRIRVSEMNVEKDYDVGRWEEYRDTRWIDRSSDGTFRSYGKPIRFAPFPQR